MAAADAVPSTSGDLIFARYREPLLMAITAIVLTLALYGEANFLPVFHDDLLFLRAINHMSVFDLFTLKGDLTYYRPASLAPWVIIRDMSGHFAPDLIHGWNVILEMLCAWLTGLAARRLLPGRSLAGWGALILFLVFPFNYQTVTWAISVSHLQLAAGALGSILLLERWWDGGRWPALAGAWLCLGLATFSHENGSILAALPLGWLLIARLRLDLAAIHAAWRRLGLALAPPIVLSIVYVSIWLSLARQGSASPQIDPGSIGWNLAYLAQGLAYPLAQFGGLLVRAGGEPVLAAALLDAAGIGLLAALLWANRDRRMWIVGWWYAASVLPAAVFLSSDYAVDGPRLMTTASVAAALGWAVGIEGLWARTKGWQRAIPAALAALMVAGGGWFVISRMAMEEIIGTLYNRLMMEITPQTQGVVVNLPAWLSGEQAIYALGNEGVAYLGDYQPLPELVWANTGITPRLRAIALPEIMPVLPGYIVGLSKENHQPDAAARVGIVRGSQQIFAVRALGNRWELERASRRDALPGGAATFADGNRLALAASYDADRELVEVTLTWQIDRPEAATPFVHLWCAAALVGQADGAPLAGMYPLESWLAGERWAETRLIAAPARYQPECLTVRAGLYHPETGVRVPVAGGGDSVTATVQFAANQ